MVKGLFVKIIAGQCKITNPLASIKRLSEISSKGCFVQAVSSRVVYSKTHVLFALNHCISLFEAKNNRLEKPSLEFLLTLFAKTQLKDAISATELSKGTNECYLVACASDKKLLGKACKEAKKILFFKAKKIKKPKAKNILRIFGISKQELKTLAGEKDALEKLVLEKIALSFLK